MTTVVSGRDSIVCFSKDGVHGVCEVNRCSVYTANDTVNYRGANRHRQARNCRERVSYSCLNYVRNTLLDLIRCWRTGRKNRPTAISSTTATRPSWIDTILPVLEPLVV